MLKPGSSGITMVCCNDTVVPAKESTVITAHVGTGFGAAAAMASAVIQALPMPANLITICAPSRSRQHRVAADPDVVADLGDVDPAASTNGGSLGGDVGAWRPLGTDQPLTECGVEAAGDGVFTCGACATKARLRSSPPSAADTVRSPRRR